MIRNPCLRENEVLEAVRANEWPGELRNHVTRCDLCTDLISVVGLLRADSARWQANVPDANVVWWKGQLAARRAAAARAARFISLSELFAGLIALGVVIAFLVSARAAPVARVLVSGGIALVPLTGLVIAAAMLVLHISYLALRKEPS